MNNKDLRIRLRLRSRLREKSRLRFRSRLRKFLTSALTLAFFVTLAFLFRLNVTEGKEPGPVRFLGFHAHKYQDFEKKMVSCEVFGEMENLGTRKLRGARVEVDLLDEKGKVVYSEEMELLPRVIVFGNPKGVEQPLKHSEIGIFSMNTKECPEKWLEGRIKFRLIEAITGE